MVDELENRQFPIPEKLQVILQKILETYGDRTTSQGYKRLKNLLQQGQCNGNHLKRIKHYFDHIDPNTLDENGQIEYLLNGGDYMKNWVYKELDTARKNIDSTKTHNTNAGLENQFNAAPNQNLNVNTVRSLMPTVRTYPDDIMTNNKLMEQINKIKHIIKKLN